MSSESLTFNWSCKHTWKRSAKNTAWCLLGCSIGDFGTILFFQLTQIPFPVFGIMTLAIINGLITSIILETVILMRQNFDFRKAFNNERDIDDHIKNIEEENHRTNKHSRMQEVKNWLEFINEN